MEALPSTFLPNHLHLYESSSFRIPPNTISQTTIKKNYSSTLFQLQPIKNLISKNTPSTLTDHETLNNNNTPLPPSKQLHKTKNNQPLVIIFNTLDDLVCSYLDPPLPPPIDPKYVLSSNYAPVDEFPVTVCAVVEGHLPASLDGAYIRNGPNPQFVHNGRPYHFLDGDGMLHVIRISQGRATFCSRYVRTHKHAVEHEAGYPFIPSFFASFNGLPATIARLFLTTGRVMTCQFDPLTCSLGAANTSVALIGGKLFALCESDLPYAVRVMPDGDLMTLGRCDFQATEPFLRMTAHPKIDRETGEAFGYGYNMAPSFLTFFRIDSDGRKQKGLPIPSMQGSAIHDFAVTKNYAVFPDTQIVVNPRWILRGRLPVGVDPDKVPRIGVISRYAEDGREMWWADVAGFNMLHCVNAWEEDGGDTIVVVASNITKVEEVFGNTVLSKLTLEKMTIDVQAKIVRSRHKLSSEALDFAVINPSYSMKKNRYVYAGVVGSTSWIGVVKLDLSLANADGRNCTMASRSYGSGCCGGEPFFVPREPNDPTEEEDDGYLVTYVHDENTQKSKFLVMDAKSSTLDILAVVELPQRVPNGFHGLFVSENDLN